MAKIARYTATHGAEQTVKILHEYKEGYFVESRNGFQWDCGKEQISNIREEQTKEL